MGILFIWFKGNYPSLHLLTHIYIYRIRSIRSSCKLSFFTFSSFLSCSNSLVCHLCCVWLYKYPPVSNNPPFTRKHPSSPFLSPFFNLILSLSKSPLCPQWKHPMCLQLLCTPQSWPLHVHTAFFISLELCLSCRRPLALFRLRRWRNKLRWSTKFFKVSHVSAVTPWVSIHGKYVKMLLYVYYCYSALLSEKGQALKSLQSSHHIHARMHTYIYTQTKCWVLI